MNQLRSQPVSRWKVLAGALLFLVAVGALIGLAEWLRPARGTSATPITPELDSDPRIAVECEAPPPREGARPRPRSRPRAVEVTSAELYDCPSTWDGRRVRFTGEVVGGVLQRGDYAWLQVNDDHYSTTLGPLPAHRDFRGGNGGVGVAVPGDLLPQLREAGGPGVRGDIVEVSGIYRRVDRETREVAVIRADALTVLEPGVRLPREVDVARAIVAILLGLAALTLVVVQWRVRRMT